MQPKKYAPHRQSGALADIAPDVLSDKQLVDDIMDLVVTPDFPAEDIRSTERGYRLRPRQMLLNELIRLRKQYGEVTPPSIQSIDLPPGMTDKMYCRMCDANMSDPVPLEKSDLNLPFVYERRWGVFYVPMGSHQGAMALLLAWQRGYDRGVEAANAMGLLYASGAADHWLEHTPGAAFRSSVRNKILVAKVSNLSIRERRIFGAAGEILELMP